MAGGRKGVSVPSTRYACPQLYSTSGSKSKGQSEDHISNWLCQSECESRGRVKLCVKSRVVNCREYNTPPHLPLLPSPLIPLSRLLVSLCSRLSAGYLPPYTLARIVLGATMVRLAFSFSIITTSDEQSTATSNAPSIGRKRRMNDDDADEEAGSTRKRRGQLERQESSELGELGVKEVKGSEADSGVKQVTRGVKEVELEDKKEGSSTNDGKPESVDEEASKAKDGESGVAAPLGPAHATQNVDGPSQDVTATDDEAPAGQSEAIAEAPSNDPPEVEAPTSSDIREPPIEGEEEEKELLDSTPGARSEEVSDTRESVGSSPNP